MGEMQSDKKKSVNRSRLIAGVFSLLFSAAILFGARLDSVDNVDIRDWKLWVSLLVLTLICSGLVPLLWRLLDLLQEKRMEREADAGEEAAYGKTMLYPVFFLLHRMNIYRWRPERFPPIIPLCMCFFSAG